MIKELTTPSRALKAKIKYAGSERTYDFIVHQYDEDGVFDVFGVFRSWSQVLEIEEE